MATNHVTIAWDSCHHFVSLSLSLSVSLSLFPPLLLVSSFLFSFSLPPPMESESAVLEDYESVLEELTFNSKPIINMLTMKADKYRVYAPAIVELVKTRFFKVVVAQPPPQRTPLLPNHSPFYIPSRGSPRCILVCPYIFLKVSIVLFVISCHEIVNSDND